jgi:hypothetical protein
MVIEINTEEFNRRCDENVAACERNSRPLSFNDLMAVRKMVRNIMEWEVKAKEN